LQDNAVPERLTPARLFSDPPLSRGAPLDLRFVPGGQFLTYRRAADDDRERMDLWKIHLPSAKHELWVDARELGQTDSDVTRLTAQERAERERRRQFSHGITQYLWHKDGQRLLVPLDGQIYLFEAAGEHPRAMPLCPPDTRQSGMQLSPAGNFISYVRGGDLYITDLEQQQEAGRLGMWAFLITEILFFGGLFAAYAVYRASYPQAFARASRSLDVALGGLNTAILIGSSLTMALAVRAAQLDRVRAVSRWLLATLVLGGVFVGIKGVEYAHKAHEHLIPGPDFVFQGVPGGPEQLFFALYFCMTGLHAFHMLIGFGLILWLLRVVRSGRVSGDHHPHIELFGLYWHFVDIVWIFLFPLLYLIGRHS